MDSFKIGLQGFCKKQCWGFELSPDSPVWYLNGISKETAQSALWIQREIFTIRDLAELHQIFNEVHSSPNHGFTKHKVVQKRASEFMNTYKSYTQQQKTLESPIPSRGELARKRLFCGNTTDVVESSFELKHHTDSGDLEELETSGSTPIQNLSDNESLDSSTDLSGPRWDADDDILLTTSTPNKKTTPTPSNLNNYPRTPTNDFLKDVRDPNEINFMREFSSYGNQEKSWLTTSKKRSQEVPQLEVDPLIFGSSALSPDGYRTPKGRTRRCPQRRLTKQLAALSLAETTSTPPGSPISSKFTPRSLPPSEPSTPTKTSTTPVAPCRSLGSKQRLSSCRSESIDGRTGASTKKESCRKNLYRVASIS